MGKKDDNSDRKVILYIAMSMDGYISQKNDDLTFLSAVDRIGRQYESGLVMLHMSAKKILHTLEKGVTWVRF